MAIAVTMPSTSYAQKNRSKRKTKKAKTEVVVGEKAQNKINDNGKAEKKAVAEASQGVRDMEKVIDDIDKTFSSNINRHDLTASYYTTKSLLGNCSSGKYLKHKSNVLKYYYEAFYQASDEENLEGAVDCALKYVMLDGTEDEDVLWKFLVEYYATDGDTENTKLLLEKFKEKSSLKSNCYSEIIQSLETKYNDVINPMTFDDAARGYWISLSENPIKINKYKAFNPDYIFKIEYLHSESGCKMLNSPSIPWDAEKHKNIWRYKKWDSKSMLNNSQALLCDVDNRYIRLVFGSEKMEGGHTELAHNLLEGNRERTAEMAGKINSSDGNLGQILAGHAVNILVGSLIDALAISLADGSKNAKAYEINLYCESPTIMKSSISYREVEYKNSGTSRVKENKPNQEYTFVKWEPSDSIVFFNDYGKPIFVGDLDENSPLLDEYRDIKKRINFWKPKYCIPTFLGAGVGAFCLYKSIKLSIDEIKYNKSGSVGKKGKQALVWAICGGAAIGGTLGFFITKISLDRLVEYNKINKRNMEKMRNKAATLSLIPSYNPIDKAFGMNANITF